MLGYNGPLSDHFDGERFRNQRPLRARGFRDLLRWQRNRNPGPWPSWTDAEPGPPPPRVVQGDRVRVTFVNHSTVLIQLHGVNILTDPVWSNRASPVSWAGPRRRRPPGIRFEDLPPVHLVVISHNHYDHLDLPTLKRLYRKHRPRFVVGLGNAELLRSRGIDDAIELDWWQRFAVTDEVSVTMVPAQHFSSRGLCDHFATLWGGYVVQGRAGSVYFAGDTGFGPHFAEVRARLGPPRLAILPIGAFRPRWFMSPMHISPDQAVEAHRLLGARTSLAVHFGTFPLGDDGQDEPVTELRRALKQQGVQDERFWVLAFGEGRDVP
jgi:L-ascorbate metabolism protein UlaG (beta-lactamase superfamily)